jgi:hypothetical protein
MLIDDETGTLERKTERKEKKRKEEKANNLITFKVRAEKPPKANYDFTGLKLRTWTTYDDNLPGTLDGGELRRKDKLPTYIGRYLLRVSL